MLPPDQNQKGWVMDCSSVLSFPRSRGDTACKQPAEGPDLEHPPQIRKLAGEARFDDRILAGEMRVTRQRLLVEQQRLLAERHRPLVDQNIVAGRKIEQSERLLYVLECALEGMYHCRMSVRELHRRINLSSSVH